jgi:hypothetical protein
MGKPAPIWIAWLLTVSVGVVLFGLTLVVAPELARTGFSALVFGDTGRIGSFDPIAVRYISLAHAVIGGVMVGWGVALVLVVRGPFAAADPIGWRIIALSVLAWFVPDTAYSLWSGFWQNAVLNLVFLMLFAVPLLATRNSRHDPAA